MPRLFAPRPLAGIEYDACCDRIQKMTGRAAKVRAKDIAAQKPYSSFWSPTSPREDREDIGTFGTAQAHSGTAGVHHLAAGSAPPPSADADAQRISLALGATPTAASFRVFDDDAEHLDAAQRAALVDHVDRAWATSPLQPDDFKLARPGHDQLHSDS